MAWSSDSGVTWGGGATGMCQCSYPCSSLTCWSWLVPISASGCASSARDSFPSRCWGLWGRVPALQPRGSHLTSAIPGPGLEMFLHGAMEPPAEHDPMLPAPNAPHTSWASRGNGVPLPTLGSQGKGRAGVPQPCAFGSTWRLLPSTAPGHCVTTAWQVLVLHMLCL